MISYDNRNLVDDLGNLHRLSQHLINQFMILKVKEPKPLKVRVAKVRVVPYHITKWLDLKDEVRLNKKALVASTQFKIKIYSEILIKNWIKGILLAEIPLKRRI